MHALKFLWAPLMRSLCRRLCRLDRPSARMGAHDSGRAHRRDSRLGLSAIPGRTFPLMGVLALIVAFLSASQDIVIDAYRVELLGGEQQGPGAGMIQTGHIASRCWPLVQVL